MHRTRMYLSAIAATAITGTMIVGAGGGAGAATTPRGTPLAGSEIPFTSHAAVTGDVAGSQRLSIQVWLRPRLAAAEAFATAVSTPGNRLFRHYLSPVSYTRQFGATPSEARSVASWLHSRGFTGIHSGPQLSYVRATAATSAINAAFRVRLLTFRSSATFNAGRYPLRGYKGSLTVPASLAASVLGVTGLDNAAPVTGPLKPKIKAGGTARSPAASVPCSQYYGQNMISGLPPESGTTSFPNFLCGYSATQIRAAYGANMVNTGKGQTVALVELGLTHHMFLTLQDYAAHNAMPAPSSRRYAELSLGQGSACGDPFDIEEQLDVESAYDMAPGAHELVVGGDSCNNGDFGLQGLFDAETAVLGGSNNHPLASAASNSWESGTEGQAPSVISIEHAFLLRAAAEGVGMYFSSGDGSGVLAPSDDPFAIAVGGTSLGLGKTNNRLFETGWSDALSFPHNNMWVLLGEVGAAGGGPSLLWNQPRYQKGVVPAALSTPPGGNRGDGPVRSIPDISADADLATGFALGLLKPHTTTYFQVPVGGTSLSAPLMAGMVTAAQQGQPHPFGFINPAVYKLDGTSALHDPLPLTSHSPALYRWEACEFPSVCGSVKFLFTFDDQTTIGTGQVTLKGYDNMTGVGTPNGQRFIAALRKLDH